ncbi:MAG: hypothetical protein R2771_10100 [Saprospiraceae bacterium]
MPTNSTVKEFGKNTEYKGNAIEKIKNLADDLDLAIDDYELNQVGERNNQERGLDIIGWLPFNDKCGNKVVFFANVLVANNMNPNNTTQDVLKII